MCVPASLTLIHISLILEKGLKIRVTTLSQHSGPVIIDMLHINKNIASLAPAYQ